MAKAYLFALLLIACHLSFGQREGNIWYFGTGVGLDFNDCEPVVLTDGSIDGYEGCATVSDGNTGELLFYTNSDFVWNRNHQIMPSGDLLPGNNSNTQVLIVPKPESDSLYYIFTTENQANGKEGFRYHLVDMSKNGGLGDVIVKDQLIYSTLLTEKVIAIPHSNGKDVWVIGHECGTNVFFSFLVTAAGVSVNPVRSSIGRVHEYNIRRSNWDAIGEMRASPNGEKIAVATYDKEDIELFDFDKSSGILSNEITLYESGASADNGNFSRIYGLSFSPNSLILYTSVGENPGKLIQYDISSGNQGTISSSKTTLFMNDSESIYGLKLAPDGKIYAGGQFRDFLGIVHNPNRLGFSCFYIHHGLYLKGKKSGWGLNNSMEYTTFCNQPEKVNEFNWSIHPNPTDDYATLTFDHTGDSYHLLLMNTLGQLVRIIEDIDVGKVRIEKNQLPTGLYLFQLNSSTEVIATGKLVIE